MELRALILAKIEELRRWCPEYNGFDFTKLSDKDLVEEFVKYVRQTFTQR